MAPYRVKPGCVLPQSGALFTGGAIVELSANQAAEPEIAALVDPVALEDVVPVSPVEAPPSTSLIHDAGASPTQE